MFLDLLRETGNVTASAARAGITRWTVYKARDRSEEFREAWDDALEEAADALEAEARRRAYEGIREPVFYQGKEVGHIRRYSDTLLIFLLKGLRRDVYGERMDHTSGGREIKSFTLDLSDASGDENRNDE